MANKKKRLRKGIESIEEQIILHKEKLRKAEEERNIELVKYYHKEITAKIRSKKEKERLLNKGG